MVKKYDCDDLENAAVIYAAENVNGHLNWIGSDEYDTMYSILKSAFYAGAMWQQQKK